ncbi:MAG: formate dehydrogenase [Casimicrobiaceae bacterium]
MSAVLQRNCSQQSPEPAQVSALTNSQRRRFLFALGAGGAGAAAVVTQSLVAPIAQVTAPEPAAGSSGYRETQHVRDYYQTTRL